jgi:hypothetical protein
VGAPVAALIHLDDDGRSHDPRTDHRCAACEAWDEALGTIIDAVATLPDGWLRVVQRVVRQRRAALKQGIVTTETRDA